MSSSPLGQSTSDKFDGHANRQCGEHRTLGGRAWCHDCTEYCSPAGPCKGCEIPALEADRDRYRKALEQVTATKNTKNICRRHGGEVWAGDNDEECWCGISLDADEKMRQIASSALEGKHE